MPAGEVQGQGDDVIAPVAQRGTRREPRRVDRQILSHLPAATSAARSRLVAEMTRTVTLMGAEPPTRRTSLSCGRGAARLASWPGRRRFVEEDGAASAVSKRPLWGRGAGEAPVRAEQLALEQALRQGRAVETRRRVGWPAGCVRQWARDQLLARPALALDQHRGGRMGACARSSLYSSSMGARPDPDLAPSDGGASDWVLLGQPSPSRAARRSPQRHECHGLAR